MGKLVANNLVATASAAVAFTEVQREDLYLDSSLTLDENVQTGSNICK